MRETVWRRITFQPWRDGPVDKWLARVRPGTLKGALIASPLKAEDQWRGEELDPRRAASGGDRSTETAIGRG